MEEEQVSFDMNLANCFQKLPMPHDFYPNDPALSVANDIPMITLSTCQDLGTLPDPATGGSECASGDNFGLGRSFLVKTYFHIGPEDGGGGTWGGYAKFEYCIETDANAPGGSVPAPVTQASGTGAVEVDSNPYFCDAL
jgi:hypothetical protein